MTAPLHLATTPPVSTRPEPSVAPHDGDLELARRVLSGESSAWNAFALRYAGLILAMIRRYLRSRDRDEIRTVFVNVLESVRRRRLRSYSGRASLVTWITLVVRSEVMDHLRRKFGRDLKLRALDRLSPMERRLFHLYYVEGLAPRDVFARVPADEPPWTYDRFVAVLHHIERKLGDRWLKRLAYDLHAQSVGAASGRLLEYLDHARDEFEQRARALRPEYDVMERDARRTVEQMGVAVAALDPQDRRLLELRFEHGWKAHKIARELGMKGQRSVYSTIDRIVSKLRRQLAKTNGAEK